MNWKMLFYENPVKKIYKPIHVVWKMYINIPQLVYFSSEGILSLCSL